MKILMEYDEEADDYVRHRRAEAWWARNQSISPGAIVNDLKSSSRSPSFSQESILQQIKDRLAEASTILEKIMRKEIYSDGDQELFAKAFDLMDISETGRIGYEIFWQALNFVGATISEADKQDIFNKVVLTLNLTAKTFRCLIVWCGSIEQVDQNCR